MKKYIKRILLGLAVFVAYATFTGGMVVELDGGFRWAGHTARDYRTDELQSSLRIVDEPKWINIPFVLWLAYSGGAPYPIELRITDNTQTARQIAIHTIAIKYGPDIQERTLAQPWTGTFAQENLLFGVGNGTNTNVPVAQLTEILPVTVDEGRSCEIRLIGNLEEADGTIMPFDSTWEFSFQPEVRTYTFWSGLHD